ncbi:MAG: lipase maturation factor family protein, partial [Elusimicrobia bacterium]|nr:lipase maturation factor family protein [Elusimicrobiota bacterium]
KILSHDPSWASFTAMGFHYQTQPLPTPVAWFMYQAPAWFHKFEQGIAYGAEIILPFFLFLPRRARHLGARLMILFQALIAITGNFCFFNFLSAALCLPVIDDTAWPSRRSAPPTDGAVRWPSIVTVPLIALLFILSLPLVSLRLTGRPRPYWLAGAVIRLSGFEVVNDYGLFSVMTTRRTEIEIQGSDDGKEWKTYEFRYKPGPVNERPRFVAPHQPRLDWQMWFAALSDLRSNPWLISVLRKLLEGSSEVGGLFKSNPFSTAPPVYVRAVSYNYRFTTAEERRKTGDWWHREEAGLYCPPVSFRRVEREDEPAGTPPQQGGVADE